MQPSPASSPSSSFTPAVEVENVWKVFLSVVLVLAILAQHVWTEHKFNELYTQPGELDMSAIVDVDVVPEIAFNQTLAADPDVDENWNDMFLTDSEICKRYADYEPFGPNPKPFSTYPRSPRRPKVRVWENVLPLSILDGVYKDVEALEEYEEKIKQDGRGVQPRWPWNVPKPDVCRYVWYNERSYDERWGYWWSVDKTRPAHHRGGAILLENALLRFRPLVQPNNSTFKGIEYRHHIHQAQDPLSSAPSSPPLSSSPSGKDVEDGEDTDAAEDAEADRWMRTNLRVYSDLEALHDSNHLVHPEYICIFYLNSIGEPTVVTDLTISDAYRLAKGITNGELTEYWLIYPKANKLVCFSGEYVHGILYNKSTHVKLGPNRKSAKEKFRYQPVAHKLETTREKRLEAGQKKATSANAQEKQKQMALISGWWDREIDTGNNINVELEYHSVENLWVMQEGGRIHTMREAMASRAAMDQSGLKLAPMAFIEKTTPKVSRIDQEIPANYAIYEFALGSKSDRQDFLVTPRDPVSGTSYHFSLDL